MVMLHEGRVVMEGTPEEFRRSPNPAVQRFLRGEATQEDLADIPTLRPIGAAASPPPAHRPAGARSARAR
jgi:ABC-type uncharacterized transport system ATPase subunit